MDQQEQQLRAIFAQTLSPDVSSRTAAESALTAARSSPGHALGVLRIVASASPANGAVEFSSSSSVRQANAVHFKNLVKRGWVSSVDPAAAATVLIPDGERATIKTYLVELMCTVPPQIRSQCSESIALIAATDFPERWDHLLPFCTYVLFIGLYAGIRIK